MRVNTTRVGIAIFIALGFFAFTTSFASAATYPPDRQYSPVAVPNLARPGYLVPVIDPVTGAKLTRITDATAFGASNVRHGYSVRPPWNSDQTLILLDGTAIPKLWILDAKTYKILGTVPRLADIRWSSTDPNKLYGVSGNKFVAVNARTGAMTTLRTFSEYNSILIGPYKGNISIGDKYVALQADANAIIVYDISTDTVIANKPLSALGYSGRTHWLSMSQSGNYIVISNHLSSASYDRTLNKIATLEGTRHLRHGDLGYDASGNEVYVQICPMAMIRLSSGQKTDLFSRECGHISTRNFKRPGWAYAIFAEGRPQDVLAVKLDGSKTVERFTHHRSTQREYIAQAHVVASPDGTKVMFASDWNGMAEINSYVVEMPHADAGPPPPGTPPSPTGPSPVAHWKLDEVSGTTADDASLNNTNLTLSGGAAFAPGKLGNALSFNGTTARAIDTVTTGLNATSVLTIAAWVKPTSLPPDHSSVIVRKGNRPNARGYSMMFLGNKLTLNRVYDQRRPGQPLGVVVSNVSVPVDGAFHHVAITWSAATRKIEFYLDGVLADTMTAPWTIADPADTDPVSVGYHLEDPDRSSYSGLIDDLRIYNRVLSGADMSALAGNAAPVPPPSGTPSSYTPAHFTQLVTDWLKTKTSPADVNRDGTINARDLGIMMGSWRP